MFSSDRFKPFHLLPFMAGLLFASCATTIKVPVVSHMPEHFMQVMKGGKRIGVVAVKAENVSLSDYGDWTATLQGAVENALNEAGYFQIVDIQNRRERLQELAHTQSGLTSEQKSIGQELTLDGLFYVQVPNPPHSDCRVESAWKQKTICTEYQNNKCVRQVVQQYQEFTGVLNMTVFLKGKLVNLETGETLQYTNTKPSVFRNSAGNPQCPSVLNSFSEASNQAAQEIVHNISPTVTKLPVPLYDGTDGVPDPAKDQVKSSLKAGIKWADSDPPDYDLAKQSWEQALDLSGNTSIYAFWNLAAYYWYTGDMDKAQEYFTQAQKLGGDSLTGSTVRKVISTFNEEKKRKDVSGE